MIEASFVSDREFRLFVRNQRGEWVNLKLVVLDPLPGRSANFWLGWCPRLGRFAQGSEFRRLESLYPGVVKRVVRSLEHATEKAA